MWQGGWKKELRLETAAEKKKERFSRAHEDQLKLIQGRPGESKKETKRLTALVEAGHVSYEDTENRKKAEKKGKKNDKARSQKARKKLHSPT